MNGNSYVGFYFDSPTSYYNELKDNRVNGDVYYHYVNEEGVIIADKAATADDASNLGWLSLINCTGLVVRNVTLANNNYGYGAGLFAYKTNDSVFEDINVSNNGRGIYMNPSFNNTISNSNASDNTRVGIYLLRSDENRIEEGTIANSNGHCGIYLYYSDENTISGVNASSNNYGGILLTNSHYNNMSRSIMTSNRYGVYLTSSNDNTVNENEVISNGYDGIYLYYSDDNTISNNNASMHTNYAGIYLYYYNDNNTLYNNTVNNNGYGIRLYSNNYDNNITANIANYNNYNGIRLRYLSNNNTIYNNYFNNTNNAYDDGNNTWNITKAAGANIIGGPHLGGNYWSDYDGIDTNHDGLGDTKTPYNSSGGIQHGGDWHPLVPVSAAEPNITSYAPETPVNDTVCTWRTFNVTINQTVNVSWYLNASFLFKNESVTEANCTLHAEVVGEHNVSALASNPGGSDMQTWIWNVAAPSGLNCTCGDICANTTGWWRDNGTFNQSSTPIQHAIDNATAGDIICVKDGNYNENVKVNVAHLTIQSENGSAHCIVNVSNSNDHVFRVAANYVNLSGFTMKNATGGGWAGIHLDVVEQCNISDNDAMNNNYGIFLSQSNNNTLKNNTASLNNRHGIEIGSSSNNSLQNNNASYNTWDGIHLSSSSDNNSLTDNTASNNDRGIILESSSKNHLIDNSARSNSKHGIFLDDHSSGNLLENNTACNNTWVGIIIRQTSNKNIITKNIATENGKGIQILESASNNTVVDNEVYSNNGAGIEITVSAHNNSITGNKIHDNTGGDGRGVKLLGNSNNNRIADNLLVNNSVEGITLEPGSNNSIVINNTIVDSGTEGIAVYSQNNVITDNYVWNSSKYGMLLSSSNNSMIANNTVKSEHGWPGISLRASCYNCLVNNNASRNKGIGIKLESNSNYNNITDNTANKNLEVGICLESSSNNTLANNTASSNSDVGIELEDSSNNLIYNNYFNNTKNAYDNATNTWNIAKTLGTNIIGGPYRGGNYWSDYEGWDTNGDGLGDTKTPYNSSGNIQNGGDYLPLTTLLDTPPASVSDLEDIANGTTWIKWSWTNPPDADFNHTAVYIDGVFEANVYAPDREYNATGLTADTTYEIGTRTVDDSGNVNQTWVNDTAKTLTAAGDTIPPTIESVTLDAYTTIPDATIHVSVEATDNVGVTSVTADSTILVDTGSTWEGDITAPSSTGDYTLTIRAEDAAGNYDETRVEYSVVMPQGGFGVAVLPMYSVVNNGDTVDLTVKIISTENFDDKLHVYLSTDGLPLPSPDLSWFNWTEQNVLIPERGEITIPLKAEIPTGESGMKMFRVKAESTIWRTEGFGTGIFNIN